MVQDIITDKRQRFHIVKLAMFNAEVLASVQQEAETNASGVCRKIIEHSATSNVHAASSAPNTINQSLFFGMAYLSLVWLWESLSEDERNKAIKSDRMNGVWDGVEARGPRNVELPWQKLRLIRNALSHGNVSIDDNFIFSFWDQNSRDKNETAATFLMMSSEHLGGLVNSFYYACSDVIYK